MDDFVSFLTYLTDVLQELMDIVMNHWVTAVLFGINVLFLIINAVKLKRNTD